MCLITLFWLLAGQACALGAQRVDIGPYTVSWDLGEKSTYWREDPVQYENSDGINYTYYQLYIDDLDQHTGYTHIGVMEYEQEITRNFASPGDEDNSNLISTRLRSIDGKQGVLVTMQETIPYDVLTSYKISYMLDSSGWIDADGEFTGDILLDMNATLTGKDYVRVFSNMEYDQTNRLLDTIHIAKKTAGNTQ